MKIIIITPTRNEGDYIRATLESMAVQTLPPYKWVIVDDGSTDNTKKIIGEYLNKCTFIEYVNLEDRGFREPSTGVINAFYKGYDLIKNEEYDVVSKFDADLEFPADTLDKIVKAFKTDEKLGITGATRYDFDPKRNNYFKVVVPPNFVGGPTKFYRKECFKQINGLINRAGWDGVDAVRANMLGWNTYELESIKVLHLKPTGSADGRGMIKASLKYGDVGYYMGGYFWYFMLRVLGRSIEKRKMIMAIYMIKGYLKSLIKRVPREDKEFRAFLKKQQWDNFKFWIKKGTNNLQFSKD